MSASVNEATGNASLAAFRALFENHSAVVLVVDALSGAIVDANLAAARFYGYPRERLCRMNTGDINPLSPDERQRERTRVISGDSNCFEFDHRLASGELRRVEITASCIDLSGRAVLLTIVSDITGRKLAEDALRATKERFEVATESANVVVWDTRFDPRGYYLSEARSVLRNALPEGNWMTVQEMEALIHPDDVERVSTTFLAAAKTGAAYNDEYRLRTLDGEWRWAHSRGQVSERGADGRALRMSGTIMDVTERRRVGDALIENEERFRRLTALTADWYWEQDAQFRFIAFSGASNDYARIAGEKSIGKTRWEIPTEQVTPEQWVAHRAALMAHLPFRDFEMRRTLPDGQIRWFSSSGVPVFAADGRFTGYHGVGRDITVRKLAELRLAETEERYRLLAETAPEGILLHFDGVIEYANPALAAMLRAPSREALLGRAVMDLIHPDDLASSKKRHFALAAGPARLGFTERRVRRFDGSWLEVEAASTSFMQNDRLAVQTLVLDVSTRKAAERELRRSQQTFFKLFHASPIPAATTRLSDGMMLEANDAWLRLFGFAREDVTGRTTATLGIWHDLADRERISLEVAGNGSALSVPVRMRRRSGELLDILFSGEAFEQDDGTVCMVAPLIDVTEAKRAEQRLRDSEQRFRDVVDAAGEYVWEIDTESRYIYLSERTESIYGYRPAEMLGRTPAHYMPDGEKARVDDWFLTNRAADASFRNLEHRAVTRSGRGIWLQVSGLAIRDQAGAITGYRGTGLEITTRKQAEERIEFLATRDALTGLPNRVLLTDRVNQAVGAAHRAQEKLAILFLDLDRFKHVNDSLGHHAGDELLKAVAQRLGAVLRRSDTLARIGGDEFVILLENLRHADYAAGVAKKICQELGRPITVEGQRLTASTSIGISIYPEDGANFATLLKNADAATYHAKEQGRANYQFFSEEMNRHAIERVRTESDLRVALELGQFTLRLQPIMMVATGELAAAEALLRWNHPERGLLGPAEFIPLAEETGLIRPIGSWVIEEVCRLQRAWRDAGLAEVPVAINVSVSQITQGNAFVAAVADALARHELAPSCLELEVTESLLMNNITEAASTLRTLSEVGIRISIDDFGTGYSSLAYLKRLPLDTLKIDREFVRDLTHSNDDLEIVRTVVLMAHSLNLRVIAEGVETAAQLAELKRLGTDEYQGYLTTEPLEPERFAQLYLRPRPSRLPHPG